MSSTLTNSTGRIGPRRENLPHGHVRALLDTFEKGLLITDRQGSVVLANARAQKCLEEHGQNDTGSLNFFAEILKVDPKEIIRRVEAGEHEIELVGHTGLKPYRARVKWIPESDWLAVEFVGDEKAKELVALDVALQELATIDPRKAQVIELRFFGGLSVDETAEVLKISPQSVLRDWKLAKAWMLRELSR